MSDRGSAWAGAATQSAPSSTATEQRDGIRLLYQSSARGDDELDAAILRTALRGAVVGDRDRAPVALGDRAVAGDVLLDEVAPHRVGAALRQLEVGAIAALAVGVALDLDLDRRVVLERLGDLVEQCVRDPPDHRAVGLEEHGLLELDLGLGDDHEVVLLRAAVGRRAGLVGALVLRVGDAVLVVVGIRAAIGVLEAVAILGFVGTLVELVGDAVAVVVVVGAAVGVLEAVAVLGDARALIDVVGDAVAVHVAGAGQRHAGLDAALLRRFLDRELRVGLGGLGLAARVVVVALVERVAGEVVVRLGRRELDRSPALRAVRPCGRDQPRGRVGPCAHRAAGATRERDRGEHDRCADHRGSFAGAIRGGELPGSLAGPGRSFSGTEPLLDAGRSRAGATGASVGLRAAPGATPGAISPGRFDGSPAAT